MKFEFVEFNPRRRARGVEAARVRVTYDDDPDNPELIWMSEKDVRNNIIHFGLHEGLTKALDAYIQARTGNGNGHAQPNGTANGIH